MKPPPFDYRDPQTLDEALELLADSGEDAVVIAGGQSLVPLLNLRLARPELVVDLRRISELQAIRLDRSGLTAGAMVTAVAIEEHPEVTGVPGLAEALSLLGHPQIRNRTTVGGSLAHADPAAELPALALATEGWVTLQSRDRGRRRVGVGEFLVGPFMTARDSDELVTEVEIPAYPGTMTVVEVAARPGDFATAGAVVGLRLSEGRVLDPRIVVFGATATPSRATEAETALVGLHPTDAAARAAEVVRSTIDPVDDAHAPAAYRRHVAGTLVSRAVADLGSRVLEARQ